MKSCAVIVFFAFGAGGTMHVSAAEGPLTDRFSIGLGSFLMTSDTKIRADNPSTSTPGTNIELEDAFGFNKEDVIRADLAWRISTRHKLTGMYFNSSRSTSRTLDAQINFNETVFPVNAVTTAKFSFDITELSYQYSFMVGERHEIGASFGVHNAGVRLGLSATVTTPGGGGTVALDELVRANAPLPVFGLRGAWQLTDRLFAEAHLKYFKLAFGDYRGRITDTEAALVWQVSRHFNLGAAYNLFDTEVDVNNGEDFAGKLDWRYRGAQLFVRATF